MIGIIILIQIDLAHTYRTSCDKKKEKEDTTAIYVCIYIPRRKKISTQSAKVQLFLGPFKHHLYSSGRETTHEMEIC